MKYRMRLYPGRREPADFEAATFPAALVALLAAHHEVCSVNPSAVLRLYLRENPPQPTSACCASEWSDSDDGFPVAMVTGSPIEPTIYSVGRELAQKTSREEWGAFVRIPSVLALLQGSLLGETPGGVA